MQVDYLFEKISAERIWDNFATVCDFGGRVCGSEGEKQTVDFLRQELSSISGGRLLSRMTDYKSWQGDSSIEMANGTKIKSQALLFSPVTPEDGLVASLKDIGEGNEKDFIAMGQNEIEGKIVLVRHSYMFSSDHVHRMRKYKWAREYGASGFIIANPWPDSGIISGGLSPSVLCGQPIPGVGVDAMAAAQLSMAAENNERIRMNVKGQVNDRTAESLLFDLPGTSQKWVAVSAHIDGHDLAESAMDNASGLAVVLEMARLFAFLHKRKLGCRFCFFNLEEWGLVGSEEYLKDLSPLERENILFNINLDTVGGDRDITALIGEQTEVNELVMTASENSKIGIKTHRTLPPNSDHYNFARVGIPALRLVAGFNKTDSNLRFVLTEQDRRKFVSAHELVSACKLATALACAAERNY